MKILVIGLSNLGDALLTYPAMHALWHAHPEAEFHLLASPRTRELFSGDPRVRQVWIWNKRADPLLQLQLIMSLCRERFSIVVDFRNSLIPFFMPWARRTPVFFRPKPDGHRADTHLGLVTRLGLRPYGGRIRLPFDQREERKVEGWLEPGRTPVVIVPGARSHLKRWGAEKFAQVADWLIERHQAQVLLAGEEAERPIADQMIWAMRNPVTDLVGRTSVRQLADLLSHAKLVITNDNACLHMASMAGAPTVAVFGPTDERKYGPRAPGSAVVRRALVCAPCELSFCPYRHECMEWITADEVYAAAAKVLAVHPEADLRRI